MLSELKDITAEKEREFKLTVEGFESAPDALLMVNVEGVIILANETAESLLGYNRTELKGQQVEMLVPEEFRSSHPDRRREFWRNPEPRQMGKRVLPVLHKDGYTKPVVIRLKGKNLPDPIGRFTIVALRDAQDS